MGRDLKPAGSLDDYLSISDAAISLDKCTKTVRCYIKRGILKSRRFRGKGKLLWIHSAEVNALKQIGDRKLRITDMWDLLKSIKLCMHSMNNKLDYLMHISGLDVSPLRDVPINSLISIYEEICELIEKNAFDLTWNKMEEWAKVFLQFSEIEYDRLIGPTMNDKPWRPFYLFCRGLMNTLRRRKGFGTHPEMQGTYRLLNKARKQIAQSALVFEEIRSARLGPLSVKEMANLGVKDDPLDYYIFAESEKRS